MLYYSCYFFNFFVDYFRLEYSVECALYHVVFKKKIITLTISCYVCSSERNKVVECKTCETVRTLWNVGQIGLIKYELLHSDVYMFFMFEMSTI
jgi:hypothetical protein